MLILEAQKLVLGKLLTVYTPHDLEDILSYKGELCLSDNQLLGTKPSSCTVQR
jgi:hypothetical protein